ncbi:uncharacterized protein LOC129578577 [Sitodiplosis mosellana]|uniref:uncharacterized protein LOC129578577 n=1 Tax=Sitodiplosis mosellana TaxID=263140 RepID=UPI002444EC3F|nr:uncharacterized protein LOC129578577 [Sitodiplosis mosellana]XP_055323320.1 uncharacterized protein LOC129578577 [Sitodiplosis mosellana]XP_055323321.1 uncharacterized protein LOC129578577 [Sitodiplosis mosellana]
MKPGFLLTFLLAGSTIVHASSQTSITLGNKLRSKRSQGELSESSETICARFSTPMENKTFFSPIDTTMLSDTYPPKVDCILKITVDPGFVIKLDFRNRFYIEPSATCEYDYLEIRDGQYGFSNLKGKYCGNKFPDEIFSSDRYLWLRFHSDDNIEYDGFEGVYEEMPRSSKTEAIEECFFNTDNQIEGRIGNQDINETFIRKVNESAIPLDCLWKIEVRPDWQIMLSVDKFDLDKKNDCDSNFVDIIGSDTKLSEPKKHFCGVVAEAFESKSNILYVRFFVTKMGINSKFSFFYTAFTKKKPTDGKNTTLECGENEFDCDDETCIDLSLKCNQRANCKFRKDEMQCGETEGDTKDLWVIIAVFSALLGAMTSVFLFNCIRTLIRDQKIIRETIRQSKESKLDEAGRMSIKRSLENVNRIIPGATGYAIEPRLKQIQDEDAGHIFREATSASSISDSVNRINKNQYNYRDELKKILRNPPPEAFNNNEHAEQYVNEGVCDMACQTRESLFASGISSSTKLPPSNTQAPGTYKFSTFGYNPLDDDVVVGAQEIPMQSTYDRRDASITPKSTSPGVGVVYTYEHPSKYETPSPAPSSATTTTTSSNPLRTFGSGPKKNAVKMEQSQLMLEIRNSAPDVIIMTSH